MCVFVGLLPGAVPSVPSPDTVRCRYGGGEIDIIIVECYIVAHLIVELLLMIVDLCVCRIVAWCCSIRTVP